MPQYRYLRWFFLALGLATVIGLTGMNVYSLYALHESKVQNYVENQKQQMLEYTNQVRSRFRYPVRHLWQLDMEQVMASLHSPESVCKNLTAIIDNAIQDGLFSEIYLSTPDCGACDRHGAPLWRYDASRGQFMETVEYKQFVSDGLGITRTRINALIQDYRWSTRVIFDTQNSMTVALINSSSIEVVGYLLFVIDQDYLVDSYMAPKLTETFGTGQNSGITIWLHDWTKNEVLATTNPTAPYSYQNVDFIQNFPDLLNDWNLKAAFSANPDLAASRASLTRNLVVLAGAMILLLGAFVFMFLTAQRERSLAQRQAMFLANVTHELKTPLSVILAAGENLSDGRVTDTNRLKSYGSHIYNESMRLGNMIDRLLDVAKSDNRNADIQKKKTDLPEFLRNYFEKKQAYLESHNVDVHLDTEDHVPELMVDQSDLHSILDNLIDNAVKYSPEEKRIGIRVLSNDSKVSVKVTDQGIGIPKEYHKLIFNKFFRIEDALTARTKGHGLGLSIVKDLVTRNGGKIAIESSPDKGAAFTVIFPLTNVNVSGAVSHLKNSNLKETKHAS